MTTAQKIVIIGGTSAIAEHCARLWLERGASELLLIGRNAERLERVRADLMVRHPGCKISILTASLTELPGIRELVDAACAGSTPDIVLVAHGSLPDQAACQHNLDEARQALEINAILARTFRDIQILLKAQGAMHEKLGKNRVAAVMRNQIGRASCRERV